VKLVVLTGDKLEQQYLTRALADAFGDQLRAIIVANPPRNRLKSLRRVWRRYSIGQLVSRVRTRVYHRLNRRSARRHATLARVFFGATDGPGLPRPDVIRVVPGHNHPDCVALIKSIAPDVIVVYGTNVIGEKVISIAPHAIVNVHTGLSPWYRGSDTIFWALHNEEPERAGVTVHMLSPGLDAGAILATGVPEYTADDDEDSLFAKSVMLGSALLVEAVKEVAAGRARPTPQDLSIGKEYRFVDRTVAAEKRVARLLRDGLLGRPRASR
jgi:methionyl-tRNA formyltransferase